MKKLLLLTVALALPGLIFIFLKRFGKNEFEVPVFHRSGREWTVAGCNGGEVASFAVRKPLTILATRTGQPVESSLRRLAENFGAEDYEVRYAARDSVRCPALLRDADHEVLLDANGRIRGYYNVAVREEADRLILEMKIVLKRY
jgi:hypothetical protein